jgi:hypothetical protein
VTSAVSCAVDVAHAVGVDEGYFVRDANGVAVLLVELLDLVCQLPRAKSQHVEDASQRPEERAIVARRGMEVEAVDNEEQDVLENELLSDSE